MSFYDFNHKRAKRIGGTISIILGILLLFKMIPALDAMDRPQPASVPAPAAECSTIDVQAPSSEAKDIIQPLDRIHGNTVIELEDDVFYHFSDHGYMSVGLDGTALSYDVYYGIGIQVVGSMFHLTWHDYCGEGVTPTTMTLYSPYTGKTADLGNSPREKENSAKSTRPSPRPAPMKSRWPGAMAPSRASLCTRTATICTSVSRPTKPPLICAIGTIGRTTLIACWPPPPSPRKTVWIQRQPLGLSRPRQLRRQIPL